MENWLVASQTRFAFKLFAALAEREPGRNLFVSPASVALALAMTYQGARGETRQAMAAALELGNSDLQALNRASADLLDSLRGADPQVALAIASSLWARVGQDFSAEFMSAVRSSYDAQLFQVDFASAAPAINGWVGRHTGGKIDRIVDRIDPATILLLINAIYFKGSWSRQFDRRLTREAPFTLLDGRQVQLMLMSQSGKYPYYAGDGFQAVRLTYGAGRLSMYVFLPDTRLGLPGFQRLLEARSWDTWMARFRATEGHVALPRFKIAYEARLNQALEALGMAVAFGSRADFSGMGVGAVRIDEVRHKTLVEVNEEGAEAAAATSVSMVRASFVPQRTFSMVVDRPFFCAIRDDQTGAILFMGSIVEP